MGLLLWLAAFIAFGLILMYVASRKVDEILDESEDEPW